MKKWKFSLEAVRLLKERIEEAAAQKHARALVNVSRARADLAETEKELNAAALLQFSAGRKHSGRDLLQLSQYVATLEKLRRERLNKCVHSETEAALAHAALQKAAREREILDRLHVRQHSAHKFHLARQEQKWIDELAGQVKRGALAGI
jgi:flagellar export protein FliJ